MPLKNIDTNTIRQRVYEAIRDSIISAELMPGESFSIRGLASRLRVSTMPVREALWQLESERIIVIERNKSIHVNEIASYSELEEIINLRIVLETIACEKACENRPESSLGKISKILENMKKEIGNHSKYLMLNREFHFMIYQLSNWPCLVRMIDNLWARIGPYFNIEIISTNHLLKINQPCHEQMYTALCKRDKQMIVQTLKIELNETFERIKKLINK